MKFEFDLNLEDYKDDPSKDGQVNVKVPKREELRFKALNTLNNKKLSAIARDFIYRLMDEFENKAS